MDHAISHRQALLRKRKPLSENAKTALAVIALFAAYALVGTMDFNDAVAHEAAQRPACKSGY